MTSLRNIGTCFCVFKDVSPRWLCSLKQLQGYIRLFVRQMHIRYVTKLSFNSIYTFDVVQSPLVLGNAYITTLPRLLRTLRQGSLVP